MRRTNISIGKGLLVGIGILLGTEHVLGQTLPLAKGTPGNWKKAYKNIGIDTLNPTLNSLSASEAALGWELLFNGTLSSASDKWRAFKAQNFPAWQVNDSALARINAGGDIMTRKIYKSFVWTVEWRISVGGNSGMFYHADESEATGYYTGPEVQVLHNQKNSDGGVNGGLNAAGGFYDHYKTINQGDDPAAPPVVDPNSKPYIDPTSTDASGNPLGYNRVIIIVSGSRHEYWLNGIRVVSVDVASPEFKAQKDVRKFKTYTKFAALPEGYLFLQDHGNQVWFRNLKVRVLPENATFQQIWPGYNTVGLNRSSPKESVRRSLSIRAVSGGVMLDLRSGLSEVESTQGRAGGDGAYMVVIRSLTGELLSSFSGTGNLLRIDRASLPSVAGAYLISAEFGGFVVTEKFVLP